MKVLVHLVKIRGPGFRSYATGDCKRFVHKKHEDDQQALAGEI